MEIFKDVWQLGAQNFFMPHLVREYFVCVYCVFVYVSRFVKVQSTIPN